MRLTIINGPNLNMLGIREPQIYGNQSFDTYLAEHLRPAFPDTELHYIQSNVEGELVNAIQACFSDGTKGIIINAGAYTHTSIALADALAAVGLPAIEVHISNVLAREDYRKTSFIATRCIGSVSGLGLMGYELAIRYFLANKHS